MASLKEINTLIQFYKSIYYKRFPFQINTVFNTTVFNIDNNMKCFLSRNISTLELFLKAHVTQKTGVMTAENSALHHINKLHSLIS